MPESEIGEDSPDLSGLGTLTVHTSGVLVRRIAQCRCWRAPWGFDSLYPGMCNFIEGIF